MKSEDGIRKTLKETRQSIAYFRIIRGGCPALCPLNPPRRMAGMGAKWGQSHEQQSNVTRDCLGFCRESFVEWPGPKTPCFLFVRLLSIHNLTTSDDLWAESPPSSTHLPLVRPPHKPRNANGRSMASEARSSSLPPVALCSFCLAGIYTAVLRHVVTPRRCVCMIEAKSST